MYAKVALLLLSLIAAAAGETCTCGGLKACVDQKNNAGPKSNEKCISRCRKELPGSAAKVQKCIDAKQNALEKLNEKQVDCFLNPAMGACVAPRARRQSDPNNFFVQPSASDFQPESDPNNFFVQPSASDFQPESNRGKWIQPEAQAQTGIDVNELLKPYNDCMHKCLKDIRPEEEEEDLAPRTTVKAEDSMRHNLAVIQECQITEKCTINLASLAEAARSSCQSDSADNLSYKQDVNVSFCRCVRGVLQKSDSEMPCLSEANF